MSQQNNTYTNLLIHDANGQSQILKVVSNASGNKTIVTNAVKNIFRTHDGAQGSVLGTGTQAVLRQIGVQQGKGQRIVALPIQQVGQSQPGNKGGQIIQKTLRFTPQQMANLKFVSTNSQSKIIVQNNSVPTNIQIGHDSPTNIANNSNTKIISPILDHTGARKRQEHENEYSPEYTKRRKSEKVGKGLRHFSMKVCEKVRRKGTTSYNEVADELVSEFTSGIHGSSPDNQQYDQKNIRRRVYDALNVLMAMNIISKEKKEIRWLGLPTNSQQECRSLEKERVKRIERIKAKTQQLHDLILQQVSFKSLVERNKVIEKRGLTPNSNSTIELPFIIVNTNKKTNIDCSISNDKSEYLFHFQDKFQIQDDIEILKRMGLDLGLDKGECTPENLAKAKSMVPKSLERYIEELGQGGTPDTILPLLKSDISSLIAEDIVETTLEEERSMSVSDQPSDEDDDDDSSSDLEVH